ncbi:MULTISPECIES: S8 family peptidase [Sphingobacterium]|uniref:S8 family peptidase n=1 Tax=Sphingobacterium TaxID=28453 RepID=UPI0013DD5C32|nr:MULTISPECIES: S8 family peptidase [unclassified Sphingobacterium]
MTENTLDHLFLDGRFYDASPYTSNSKGGPNVMARSTINREEQGNFVKVRFNEAIDDFKSGKAEQDFVYIELTSAINFEIDIDKFDGVKEIYRIAYVRKQEVLQEDILPAETVYQVGLFVSKDGIEDFLNKIDKFLNEYTPQSKGKAVRTPQFNTLFSNIGDIKAATLKSFWQESQYPFPEPDQMVWWEIWIDNKDIGNESDYLNAICAPYGIEIGDKWIRFPEHSVGLIKGTAEMLSSSVLYCNKLAELRKPKDTSDFFTELNKIEQADWVDDLIARTRNKSNESKISVCLLDSGVNRAHPLLENLIPEHHLDTIIPEAGTADTGGRNGHGTPMAGLILYGNLTDALASPHNIEVFHHLESVKLISPAKPHDPLNYGVVTQEAMDRAITINFDHKRVVCMAVTSHEAAHLGSPTSWSAALDQYCYNGTDYLYYAPLICVSAGNLDDEARVNYPLSNREESINEPAQAFNALTVGAYTDMDTIDTIVFPDAYSLAKKGTLSPGSCTAHSWENDWPNKPDIVMEGGNMGLQYDNLIYPDSLMLLSTSKGADLNKWFTSFGDTSAATALASRFAAQLYVVYPDLWAETIRALMVHSASWTAAMLEHRDIKTLSAEEKVLLLKTVGYGVPNLDRAMKSASDSLTLVSEASFTPYKLEDSKVKTNEFHLYNLPWPVDALGELMNTPVKLTVTLSYFIEPNPGNKRYAKANNYMSLGLRFKMIGTGESPAAFAGRISAQMREEDYEKEGGEKEWQLGEHIRNKGSIHKDSWEGTAADLATRNRIAVYPTSGWWKTRKKLERYDNTIRYSLIISIESPDVDIDIYTPVKQQIDVKIAIPVEVN